MKSINFNIFISQNYYISSLSLDFFYPKNIFIFSSDFFVLSFQENLQVLCELIGLFIYPILVAVVLLTTLIGLLRNMFEFSLKNYIIHWMFDFQ